MNTIGHSFDVSLRHEHEIEVLTNANYFATSATESGGGSDDTFCCVGSVSCIGCICCLSG